MDAQELKEKARRWTKLQQAIRQLRAAMPRESVAEIASLLESARAIPRKAALAKQARDDDANSAACLLDTLDRLDAAISDRSGLYNYVATVALKDGRAPNKHFYEQILWAWRDAGGGLTFSRSLAASGKSVPTGPLIRFFQAAALPVVGERVIGPERIAELIQDTRRRP